MAGRFRLRLFGAPELMEEDSCAVVRFRTRKHLGLVVYLVLEARDQAVTRDALVDLFWDDVDARRGAHSLAQALTAIRGRLGAAAVSRGDAMVRFTGDVSTDLELLESGVDPFDASFEPMVGLELCAGATFGHWVEQARERCRRAARQVLLTQIHSARASGQVTRVYERAASLYQVDPYNDEAVRALAEERLVEGDRTGAAVLLRRHLARLGQDFGKAPAELQRLLERVELKAAKPRPRTAVMREVFVGRESELARLEALWTAVQTGGLRTVLVRGPAGIGKTSLIRRFSTQIEARGWPSFGVACQEIGRNIPFAATSDLVMALAADSAVSGTDPRWLAEASRVTPGLRAVYPGVPEPPQVPAESVRLRVAESIAQMLEAAGEHGPLLITIDDLQQIDPTSGEVLHLLLRRLPEWSVLLVATARLSENQRLASEGEGTLSGLGWSEEIELAPLRPECVSVVIEGMCRRPEDLTPETRRIITELGQGNPYLTEMLVSDWERDPGASLVAAELREEGGARWHPPEMMRRAFTRQYQGLPIEAERILNLLAVAGRRLPSEEIARILGYASDAVDHAALELVERGLVRVDDGSYSFKNQLHRACVYYGMTDETRNYFHLRISKQLRVGHTNFQELLELAHHSLRAGRAEPAAVAVERGAELAIEKGAPVEAERALRGTLQRTGAPTKYRLMLTLAEALNAQGRHEETLQQVESCESLLYVADSRARAAVLRAEALQRGSHASSTAVVAHAHEALQLARNAQNAQLELRALQIGAEAASDTADFQRLLEIESTVRDIERSAISDVMRARCRITVAYCTLVRGRYDEAAILLQQSIREFRDHHLETELRRALNGLGICLTNVGRCEEASQCFTEAIALAERMADNYGEALGWQNLAIAYEDLGWFNSCAQAYATAITACERAASMRLGPHLYAGAAGLAMLLGNRDEAEESLTRAVDAGNRLSTPMALIPALLTRADLHIAQHEFELAWPFVEEALSLAGDEPLLSAPAAHLERLRSHFIWQTRGYDALRLVRTHQATPGLANRVSFRLELSAFYDWVDQQEGLTTHESKALNEILRLRLYGSIARLIALGIYPSRQVPTGRPGEPSAALVLRAFPECRQEPLPRSLHDHHPPIA